MLLDRLHEELRPIYVSNESAQDEWKEKNSPDPNGKSLAKKADDTVYWNEIAQKQSDKIVFRNQDLFTKIDKSIIRDIFGGILRSQFHVEGTRQHNVDYEPFFVLSLPIPFDECKIEDCLAEYFKEDTVRDYKMNGRFVKATQTVMLEKLPNILVLNLKRFIYRDGLIKLKEHVYFDDVLVIGKDITNAQAQFGMFGSEASRQNQGRKYRLFSVVEHKG